MLKTILIALASLFLATNSADTSVVRLQPNGQDAETGVLEKMIVANGSVTMDLDLNRLNGIRSKSQMSTLRFDVTPNSFFTILVFNNELRGPIPSSMELIAQTAVTLPAPLGASYHQLVVESMPWGEPFELAVRDEKTGFVFFNIEGNKYDYDAAGHLLSITDGRLLVSKEFAAKLGRPSDAGSIVGKISVTATMRAIEITHVVNGEATSAVLPNVGSVPGPDVIVGDLNGLSQPDTAAAGTQVGISVGTDSCNLGTVDLDWFQTPNNDHPVIPQNLYRMSGGASNNERFEQIGQSSVKHAFTALTENICGLGCNNVGGTHLGSGCSDPYVVSLNSGGASHNLGSRAWINPFTGVFPRADSATPPNSHTGHTHNSVSHRMLVEVNDLNTALNAGATYYAEAQYITPHEYVWCQAHAGQCNMYNNVSHRQYTVSGTASPFGFSAAAATVRMKAAVSEWPGATFIQIEPDPGNDGIAFVGYKVTNTAPGVWHYEYAIYNQNLDRSIQSFSVPVASGLVFTNVGFHAPPQHPAWANDGTLGSAGYSSTPWTPAQTSSALTWSSETLAQNQNANAIRWGTLYNFRFDSDRPPQTSNATIGFFKNGAPILVPIQGPTVNPTISITDVSVTEGNAGTKLATFNVNLSSSSTDTVTVQYATANGLANSSSDYVAASGTLTFTPGQTTQPISITINGDTLEEPNETYFVNLTNPVNATLSDSQGLGTITNDDAAQAALPSGFAEAQINGLSNPTAFALHPDGRIFVCEQGGTLRVIKNDVVLPTPFTTITVNFPGGSERGLLGIAIDPNYAGNHFVYVYYTSPTPSIHNRVSRFTADSSNEDVAVVGSEVVLLDLDNLSGATNHNGGAIHFGPDGKLYVAVGENANSANAQSLANRLGKMLRINSDGTIPADNPTTFPNIAGSPTGLNRAIWAVGLRNPYTFTFQSGTGRMHINDVGQNTWEEVNNGIVGSNYGWPTCEGTCGTAGMTNPIYQYSSADPVNCAITGGDFYNPTTSTFPAQYLGKYFFSDYCGGWMKTLDPLNPPATGTAPDFLTGVSSPVDIHVANDGSLYYLARGTNSIFRVQYFGASTLAINDVTVTEGNAGTSTASFTVTLSPASAQTVTVQYATANNTALAGTDYVAAGGTVTFTPGQTSQPVSVTVNGDTQFEPNETFNVNLSGATNATIDDAQGVGTINNDDAQPTISINDVSVTEGNAGTTTAGFTVSLSNASSQSITVNYATADNTATAGSDYVAGSGTVTFTPGVTSQPVNITVNGDTTFEPSETFNVNLSSPTNATIADNQGVGTISNDDTQPTISINDVSVTEGNAGTISAGFTVSLSNTSSQTITVNYATANNTATAGSDYVSTSGTLTFTPGQTTQPISVTVNGDLLNESNETFNVNLSTPANATIADNLGVGTINNDDAQPSLSINDVSVAEGNAGTTSANFTVSLSAASGQTVTVDYGTANGTATAGSDYVAGSGTLTFAPGVTTQPLSVTINGDLTTESNETFLVNLTNAGNATIADNQGLGTINDDDSQPSLSINDVSVTEGNAGTVNATFTVTLAPTSTQTVTVQYATANGTASAADYASASGTLTFTPGQSSQPITVAVNGDTINEGNETFLVNLSNATNAALVDNQAVGTIIDDDPLPSLSINDVSVSEGNAGTSAAVFTVSLSAASGQTVLVNFTTADGTASAGSDYVPLVGTLTFAPGDLSRSLPITINGDTSIEPDETFLVNLSSPTNATIADSQGQGTIVNDDLGPPRFEFKQPNFDQPESNQSLLVTVKRTGDTAPAATVDFQTNDSFAFVECSVVSGLANQRCDYLSTSGTLSFAANEVEKSFRLITYNDLFQEGNEIINLSLSNPSGGGAQLGPQGTSTVTILDDDSGAPATNPIDGAQFFVRQHYYDFLQRVPDQSGENFWVQLISQCGADPVCINTNRVTVSDAFFFEPEYQQTAGYVVRLYRTAFGNDQPFPNPGSNLIEAKKIPNYSVFVKDRARVVGGSNLGASLLGLANVFVLRPEFIAKYPASLSGPDFVDAILATIRNDLGVEMIGQRDALVAQFNSGGRGMVLYRLADDNSSNPIDNHALLDAEYNRTFVLSEYFGYLRRNPDVPGFLFWLSQVNSGPLRDVGKQHAMVCAFITSQEYQQRFSSIFTRTNANCP